MVSWGILPLQFPYPTCQKNFVNRIQEVDSESDEDEEEKDMVQLGVQEEQEEDAIEENEEYTKTERECQEMK